MSTLTRPPTITTPFGDGDAGKTNPIPIASQVGITPGAASYSDGFPPLTRTPEASGGIPPDGEDMNGILYALSAQAAWSQGGNPALFDAGFAAAISGYDNGAVVVRLDGQGLWLNLVNGNTTDPDSGASANWVPIYSFGVTTKNLAAGNVVLTPDESARPIITVIGALTANRTITLPAATVQQWIVINATSGAFTVTAIPAGGGTGQVIAQAGAAGATTVFSDGANLWTTNFSSAGLAPIASPTFTGSPRAPTQAVGNNTTLISTTAFVQAAVAAGIAPYALKASPVFSGLPTAPTPAALDNSAKLATTLYVDRAVAAGNAAQPIVKGGTFNCINGRVDVVFPTPFPNAIDGIAFVANYQTDVFFLTTGVPPTKTGFAFTNGNAGPMFYIAVGH